MNETDLLHVLITRAPHAIPGIHIERRAIINERSARGHWLRNGIVGQADAFAVYFGLHIELETKAARGAMAKAQKSWKALCLGRRIPHLILKAAVDETPDETVGRWIEELRGVIE